MIPGPAPGSPPEDIEKLRELRAEAKEELARAQVQQALGPAVEEIRSQVEAALAMLKRRENRIVAEAAASRAVIEYGPALENLSG